MRLPELDQIYRLISPYDGLQAVLLRRPDMAGNRYGYGWALTAAGEVRAANGWTLGNSSCSMTPLLTAYAKRNSVDDLISTNKSQKWDALQASSFPLGISAGFDGLPLNIDAVRERGLGSGAGTGLPLADLDPAVIVGLVDLGLADTLTQLGKVVQAAPSSPPPVP